jgi:hypothetical protein
MGRPAAVTLEQIADQVGCPPGLVDKLREPKYRQHMLSHLRECGYTRIANKMAKNGLWRVQGAKQRIYARAELPPQEQHKAAQRLAEEK